MRGFAEAEGDVRGGGAETSQPCWMLSWGTDRQTDRLTLPRTSRGSFQPTGEISSAGSWVTRAEGGSQSSAVCRSSSVPRAVEFLSLVLSWGSEVSS